MNWLTDICECLFSCVIVMALVGTNLILGTFSFSFLIGHLVFRPLLKNRKINRNSIEDSKWIILDSTGVILGILSLSVVYVMEVAFFQHFPEKTLVINLVAMVTVAFIGITRTVVYHKVVNHINSFTGH